MKTLFFTFFLFPIFIYPQSTLIFSEYGEGSSNNKWVEIYNPTLQQISLDEYRYNFCWNGCDNLQWEFSIAFDSGFILMPGATYLLAHHNSDSILLSASNQTTNILSNGNDVAGLLHTTSNTIVDIIDVFDSTTVSNGWDIGTVVNATKNHTLIRKADVCSGNLGDWNLSDGSVFPAEWIVGVVDEFNDLNTHNSNCIQGTIIVDLEPQNRSITEVRDMLGRITEPQPNTLLLYIYNDGTVEKKIIIE